MQHRGAISGWLDWIGWVSPGGGMYRAPYGANNGRVREKMPFYRLLQPKPIPEDEIGLKLKRESEMNSSKKKRTISDVGQLG